MPSHNQVVDLRERAAVSVAPEKIASNAKPTGAISLDPAGRTLFGETAVALGYVKREDFEAALKQQVWRRSAGRGDDLIGTILLQQGLLTPDQVTTVLRQQSEVEFQFANPNICVPPRFGEVAVSLGYLTNDQLALALSDFIVHRGLIGQKKPIGAYLQEKGILSADQVSNVLRNLVDRKALATESGVGLAVRVRGIHDSASNVVAVTATLASDAMIGALELAAGLASIEESDVLLMDCNARSPLLHLELGVERGQGFLDFVASSEADVRPLTTQLKNLDAMTVGMARPEHVVALCASPLANSRIQAFRKDYRYIVVVIGDMVDQTEAGVLASMCDGVVFVVREGITAKSDLKKVKEMLAAIKTPLSGFVLAGRTMKRKYRGEL